VYIDKVLSELELRLSGNDQEILRALRNICCGEKRGKKGFSCVANFAKLTSRFWKPSRNVH